ncbi:MAG: methyltransferase domain-containing protein [Phycisphaerae bacterium]|nr:methyltransferase domain-containing protein [Phycisphaerae bacterium]
MFCGYSSPKPFTVRDYSRCFEYDIGVVEHWLSYLDKYSSGQASLAGKTVLDLGPGADLGVGVYLLSKGAGRYNAIDVNNLIKSVPQQFYGKFLARLSEITLPTTLDSLRTQLDRLQAGESDRLNYVCRSDFDIVSAFGEKSTDLVFSQAAFEHFDNVDHTVKQLSSVTRSGAIIIAEIDLKTHSRWIREKDPNSIYRYSEILYNVLRFRGSPNRVRPYQYIDSFRRHGWHTIVVMPLTTLDGTQYCSIRESLHPAFREEKNQMHYLTIMFCATKR